MANYPNNDPTDAALLIAANNVASTLNGGVSSGAAAMTLTSTVHFPASGGVTVESEAILYSGNNTAGSVLTGLTRGADSTTAAIHASGVPAYMNMQARHHNAVKDEIIAIGADLRDGFEADLDESVIPSTTAVSIKMRLDQLSNRIAALGNSTDWKSGYSGKVYDMTFASTDVAFSTAAITFTSGALQITLSMPTTTARVAIVACAVVGVNTTSADAAFATIRRGTTNLGSSAGLSITNLQFPGVSTSSGTPCSIQYLDSPATNGSVTYNMAFRTSAGGTSVGVSANGSRQTIMATILMA